MTDSTMRAAGVFTARVDADWFSVDGWLARRSPRRAGETRIDQ